MTSTTKATRATIKLGDIDLEVFQKPDGSYFLSIKQIAAAIDIDPKRLPQLQRLQVAETLFPQGFFIPASISVELQNKPVKCVLLDDAAKYWTLTATIGNPKAFALVAACVAEALERRADAAFNKVRDEQERNERLAARQDSILNREFWTDCIKEWLDNNPDASANTKAFIYANVSDALNRAFFGMTAAQIREKLSIPPKTLLRDYMPASILGDIIFTEKYAGQCVQRGMNPGEAIRAAIDFSQYPIRCPLTGKRK